MFKSFEYETRHETASHQRVTMQYDGGHVAQARDESVKLTTRDGQTFILSVEAMDELAAAWKAFRDAESAAGRWDVPF